MHPGVVGIAKLVEHPTLAIGLHFFSQIAGVLHATTLGRQDQFGAEGFHGLRPLDGQVLGHDEHHAVAFDRRGHGQRNAGVAGCGLDQGVTRSNVSPLLGALDH